MMDEAGGGEQTPTAMNDGSSTFEQQQQQVEATATVEPPPAYLVRLMEDYARQLKRRAPLRGEDEPDSRSRSSTVGGTSQAETNGKALASMSNSLQAVPEHSPRPFATSSPTITGQAAASSIRPPPPSAFPSFSLPRASLDSTSSASSSSNQKNGTSSPLTYTNASQTPNLRRLEDVYSPPKEIAPEEELLPPENFAMVSSFVYRSSFPKRKNFPFLRSLRLKSVL